MLKGNYLLKTFPPEGEGLYPTLWKWTDNELVIEVLDDIADEERVHAGEFLRLLKHLEPDEEKFYAEGAEEVEEEIKKLKSDWSKT